MKRTLSGSTPPGDSVLVSELEKVIKHEERWANEYIKREQQCRVRRAHREAAHFEDLISAHQCHAQTLRKLIADTADQRSFPLFGYLLGVEIYEGYARTNPHNCAVKERTGDGVPAGPCCFYLENGTTCPRHGKVKADNVELAPSRERRCDSL